jgi:hypothetical protein
MPASEPEALTGPVDQVALAAGFVTSSPHCRRWMHDWASVQLAVPCDCHAWHETVKAPYPRRR